MRNITDVKRVGYFFAIEFVTGIFAKKNQEAGLRTG